MNHEHLLDLAEGTRAAVETRLADTDAGTVADLVLAEVASRALFFDEPPRPVAVLFDLGVGGSRVYRQVVVGGGAAEVVPGPLDDPDVRIRQDLAELVLAVYGPAGPKHDASREVWINDSGKPAELSADDPWMVRWHSSIRAAGQVVMACEHFEPDLTSLALRFGSDKWGGHWYTPHYDRHFAPYRQQRVTVLEIGVGGYRDSGLGGASLRMWKHYFRRGLVYGLDVYDKSGLTEPRLSTVTGDQSDRDFLTGLYEQIGPLDIVVDDGSHESDHTITSFTTLFPLLPPGGLYVIEDLQASYWPGYNGNRTGAGTTVGYLKTLLDGLHHQDQPRTGPYEPSAIETGVTAVHLYHNMVFVEKGVNTEQTAPAWLPRDTHING